MSCLVVHADGVCPDERDCEACKETPTDKSTQDELQKEYGPVVKALEEFDMKPTQSWQEEIGEIITMLLVTRDSWALSLIKGEDVSGQEQYIIKLKEDLKQFIKKEKEKSREEGIKDGFKDAIAFTLIFGVLIYFAMQLKV